MKTILFLVLFFGSSFKSPGCLQLDLILVGDISYSVRGNERFISDAFSSFVNRFELSQDGVQIGMILFNSSTYLVSPLTDDKESLQKEAKKISTYVADNGTQLETALRVSLMEFSKNGIRDHRKIVIIVTDGAVDDPHKTIEGVNELNQLGIQVCGILINRAGNNATFLKTICNGCYTESSYEELGKELQKLGICL